MPIFELCFPSDTDMYISLTDPNLDASSPIIGSPLHMACSEGIPNRLEILKLLLEKGANPNLVIVGEDNSPIKPALGEYLASNEDPDVEVVNLFLKHGAEVRLLSKNVHTKYLPSKRFICCKSCPSDLHP